MAKRRDDTSDLATSEGRPHYGHAYHSAGGSYGSDGGPRYRGVLWHGTNGRIIHETASTIAGLSASKMDALTKLAGWCEEHGVAAVIHWPDGPKQAHPGYHAPAPVAGAPVAAPAAPESGPEDDPEISLPF